MMRRPELRPDAPPLEILPWGRTLADQEALERKKAADRRGMKGCLLQALIVTLALVYMAGYWHGH